ncbi:phage tail protein [Pseudomonas citronellolis]|uniref:Phage tail protein n=1 Tax=Pseudomonas citronellolis TaxID=53408 RepID=A0A1A9KGX6_9PSED|nr:phage tail protein [Pseudomonas citronellolis]ANI16758.1 phage tail protein [Pseudomonas citronellolis]
MAYMEQLQGGLKYLAQASEAGRRSLDGVIGPVNGAISEITGAASELEGLPGVPAGVGEKLRRVMRGVNAAQSKVGQVVSVYNRASRALTGIDERLGELGNQASRAMAAVNKVAGSISPSLAGILPSSMFGMGEGVLPEAVKPFPHLLILQPLAPNRPQFCFNLDTAAFDQLTRQSEFRWASQERLTRRPAQQSPGLGDERITLRGAIFPHWRGGLAQLDALREIGAQREPLNLTTGYGGVLGIWCLARVEEEQTALLRGGIPRKQAFTLEFVRYGEDMQNI